MEKGRQATGVAVLPAKFGWEKLVPAGRRTCRQSPVEGKRLLVCNARNSVCDPSNVGFSLGRAGQSVAGAVGTVGGRRPDYGQAFKTTPPPPPRQRRRKLAPKRWTMNLPISRHPKSYARIGVELLTRSKSVWDLLSELPYHFVTFLIDGY